MLASSFRITAVAVGQIFLLAAIGYLLVKRNILGHDGLDALSRLTVDITLPILIFCQLVKDFTFSRYPHWWLFPLINLLITFAGFILGAVFSVFIKGGQHKAQFLSLIAFQNSGYLPLPLIAALLPKDQADTMFIYLFLFLVGFNLVVWSAGKYMLTFSGPKKFELGSLFSPPVIAAMLGLGFVFFGLNKFVPDSVLKPLRMLGDSTLCLAMLVVGGNIAQIHLHKVNKEALSLIILAKLIILPLFGLWLVLRLRLPQLLGLLILMELAVPSATSLSVIIRHYKREDLLISQGIFFSHILSIITIPVFLSLYCAVFMLR
jgi:predicted permease